MLGHVLRAEERLPQLVSVFSKKSLTEQLLLKGIVTGVTQQLGSQQLFLLLFRDMFTLEGLFDDGPLVVVAKRDAIDGLAMGQPLQEGVYLTLLLGEPDQLAHQGGHLVLFCL